MSDSRKEAKRPIVQNEQTEQQIEVASPTVVVDNVFKSYLIGRGQSEDFRRGLNWHARTRVDALKGVSLVARSGESIGVIGLNGSGKSTLLRLISGGEAPTSGLIRVSSKPTLLGVSPALQGDLTGEQNIRLGCLALGMPPEQAREQVEEIANWTELGSAISRPMMTYSSGMSARLSFAISTAIKPEILLIDEALSTGDAAFAAKAQERIEGVISNAGNLFLVSHAISTVEQLCQRCVWIHQGKVVADGPTDLVAPQYHEWARRMGKDDKAPAMEYLRELIASYHKPTIIIEGAGG